MSVIVAIGEGAFVGSAMILLLEIAWWGWRRSRRWIRWNLRCRRGHRCANLVTTTVAGDAIPGVVFRMAYVCGGCGTAYETETMLLDDGSWVDRERQRVG